MEKKLRRSRNNQMISGVCADYVFLITRSNSGAGVVCHLYFYIVWYWCNFVYYYAGYNACGRLSFLVHKVIQVIKLSS